MNGPERMVTCWTFTPATPAAVWLAATVPMMERVPVEALFAPEAFAPVPPVEFPVKLINPVDALLIEIPKFPEPPTLLPVMLIVPVEELLTANVLFPTVPPSKFPVMVKVPEPLFTTPTFAFVTPPKISPTIAPVAAENCKQFRAAVVDLLATFAVSVTHRPA